MATFNTAPASYSSLRVNNVGFSTSVSNASKAFNNIVFLKYCSLFSGLSGSPAGHTKSPPKTILFAPTDKAIDVNAVITTLGIPALSIPFEIVATQRVQVPHVEVRITAVTPFAFKVSAILLPVTLLFSTFVPTPQVVKNSIYTFLITSSFAKIFN